MTEKKEYFYVVKGKTKKYTYCSFCNSGPYKENEKNIKYVEKGTKNTPINVCKRCALSSDRYIDEFHES